MKTFMARAWNAWAKAWNGTLAGDEVRYESTSIQRNKGDELKCQT